MNQLHLRVAIVFFIAFNALSLNAQNNGNLGQPIPKAAMQALESTYQSDPFASQLIGTAYDYTMVFDYLEKFKQAYNTNNPNDAVTWGLFLRIVKYDTSNVAVRYLLTDAFCNVENNPGSCTQYICETVDGELYCHYKLVSQDELLSSFANKLSIAFQLLKNGKSIYDGESDENGDILYPNFNVGSACPNICPN